MPSPDTGVSVVVPMLNNNKNRTTMIFKNHSAKKHWAMITNEFFDFEDGGYIFLAELKNKFLKSLPSDLNNHPTEIMIAATINEYHTNENSPVTSIGNTKFGHGYGITINAVFEYNSGKTNWMPMSSEKRLIIKTIPKNTYDGSTIIPANM